MQKIDWDDHLGIYNLRVRVRLLEGLLEGEEGPGELVKALTGLL